MTEPEKEKEIVYVVKDEPKKKRTNHFGKALKNKAANAVDNSYEGSLQDVVVKFAKIVVELFRNAMEIINNRRGNNKGE